MREENADRALCANLRDAGRGAGAVERWLALEDCGVESEYCMMRSTGLRFVNVRMRGK